MKNNFMFSEISLYNFDEVMEVILRETGGASIPFTASQYVIEFLSVLDVADDTGSGHNPYKLSFLHTPTEVLEAKQNAITLLNKLYLRYKKHYAIAIKNENELAESSKEFCIKVVNLLDYTFPKYDELLALYESNKSKLLDKLGRTRAGTRQLSQTGSNSDQHYGNGTDSQTIETLDLHNDTPKTSDILATISSNQYVSDLKKGKTTSSGSSSDNYTNTGSNSSNGTDTFEEVEGFDTMTLMAKLDEIEKQFSQLWRKWLDEFDLLFIEEVNF